MGPAYGAAPGLLTISCTGAGNGYYAVLARTDPPSQGNTTSDPKLPRWAQYASHDARAGTTGYDSFDGPIEVSIDEYGATCPCAASPSNPECDYFDGGTGAGRVYDCPGVATRIRVCAVPGALELTKQQGVCESSNGTDGAQCIEVEVTPD